METGATNIVPMKNIKPIIPKITVCPATMFAKRRIAKAKGFVNNPSNSTIAIKGDRSIGIPGGINPLKYPNKPLFLIPLY